MTKTNDPHNNQPQNNQSGSDSEAHFYLSMHEVTTSFGTTTETILEIVSEGIIPITQHDEDDYEVWRFDNEACRRIRLVLQLNRDLGVNVAGAALVLELLNEIDQLHSRLGHLR